MNENQSSPLRPISGGVWWCLTCKAPADIEDPGDAHTRCVRCGHRTCEWRHEYATRTETMPIVPDDAGPIFTRRRLRASERISLSEMTYKGYYLCQACGEPTRRDEQECCVLCGSSQVEFQPPTLSAT